MNNEEKKINSYELWKKYSDQVKSIHLKWGKKTKKEIFFDYIFRIMIVFVSSFFTTLSFDLLINPNGLYNSGLNGLIQLILNHSWKLNRIEKKNFRYFYYTSSLFINIFIVAFLKIFFNADLELISTSIFYVIFQIFWSRIFRFWKLERYIFANLPSSQNYIFVAALAAIIHTVGYLFIFESKSTPGGMDIINSYLSSKKKNEMIFLKKIMKKISFLIAFLIASLDFLILENNGEAKKNELRSFLNENFQSYECFESNDLMIEKIKRLEKNNFLENEEDKKIVEKMIEWFGHEKIRYFITKKKVEIFSSGYLSTKENLLKMLNELLEQKFIELNNFSNKEDDLLKKNIIEEDVLYIKNIIKKENKFFYQKNLFGYFKYITNNEKMLASFAYIWMSSYFINQAFPQNKTVTIDLEIENIENLERASDFLKEYDPFYYVVNKYKEDEEKKVYLLRCSLSKWKYNLIKSDVKKVGIVFVYETE